MNPNVNCLVVAVSALVTLVWLVLLLGSLFFRPKPAVRKEGKLPMRMLERMLIIVSVLMILAAMAVYLGVRSMGS